MNTITGTDYDLEYLFIAERMDGSIYKQAPDDKARISSWGSAYTDIAKERLRRFSLVGKGHLYMIDLIDGHLEIDGNKLYPPKEVLIGMELRLIYYREITRDLNSTFSTTKKGWFGGIEMKQAKPKVKYVIGWQYTYRGKNIDWQLGIE